MAWPSHPLAFSPARPGALAYRLPAHTLACPLAHGPSQIPLSPVLPSIRLAGRPPHPSPPRSPTCPCTCLPGLMLSHLPVNLRTCLHACRIRTLAGGCAPGQVRVQVEPGILPSPVPGRVHTANSSKTAKYQSFSPLPLPLIPVTGHSNAHGVRALERGLTEAYKGSCIAIRTCSRIGE